MEDALFLGKKGNRLLVTLHKLSAGIILGGSVSITVLMGVKLSLTPDTAPYLIDLVIYRLFDFCVFYPFLFSLLTAMVFGAFTRWRFFYHTWIIVKWVLLLLLFGFTWIWLGMAINGTVALSEIGGSIEALGEEYRQISVQAFRYMGGLTATVLLMFILSIWKPWRMRSPWIRLKQRTIITIVLVILAGSVGYALMTLRMLNDFRTMKIAEPDLQRLSDGVYQGESLCGNFVYGAQAEIRDHVIVNLKITKNRSSRFALYAEGVLPKMVSRQSANVDAITGATTTSKCLMKAVEITLRGKDSN